MNGHKILSALAVLVIMTAGLTVIYSGSDSYAEITTGSAGPTATWEYDSATKVLTISGTGAMTDYDWGASFTSGMDMETVVVAQGITHIGNLTFEDCSSLISVTIPDSVTSIGEYAFSSCANLTSVTIPSSVTSIGEGAFEICESLTSVIIPDGVTSIEDYTFNNCPGLASIVIPDSVTSIGDFSFTACESLTSVIIPRNVTSIGKHAFSGCGNLSEAYVPAAATLYTDDVFGVIVFPETTSIILYDSSVIISSAQEHISIASGEEFTYQVVTDPADATITLSGAIWLTVTDHLIQGIAGDEGEYSFVVSAYKEGHGPATQIFTITVIPALVITSGPSAGYLIQIGG